MSPIRATNDPWEVNRLLSNSFIADPHQILTPLTIPLAQPQDLGQGIGNQYACGLLCPGQSGPRQLLKKKVDSVTNMEQGLPNNNWLQLPPNQYRVPPVRTRGSSVSHTDIMSNNIMRRNTSQSSHVTESSHTTNSIHSDMGDSMMSNPVFIPSYLRGNDGPYTWSQGHVSGEDQTNLATSHDSFLLNASESPSLPTLDVNDPILNQGGRDSESRLLLERVISAIREQFATHPEPFNFAFELAQTHLSTAALPPVVPSRRTSQASVQIPQINQHASNADRKRYLCRMCDGTKVIKSRGSFKRHVNDKHQPKSYFLCKYCSFRTTRKDKLQHHLRDRHLHASGDISGREFAMANPIDCILCISHTSMDHLGPFASWDAWFSCVETHCRIEDDTVDDDVRRVSTDASDRSPAEPQNTSIYPPMGDTAQGVGNTVLSFQNINPTLSYDQNFSAWNFDMQ